MTAGPHIPRLVFVAVLAALVLAGPADAAVLGELGYLGCTSNDGSGGTCVDGCARRRLRDRGQSDGKHVYVAAHFSGIAVFTRDPSTGTLTQTSCNGGMPCSPVGFESTRDDWW